RCRCGRRWRGRPPPAWPHRKWLPLRRLLSQIRACDASIMQAGAGVVKQGAGRLPQICAISLRTPGRGAPNGGRKNPQISDLSFVQDAENTPECERMLAFCAGQRYNANNESDCVKFRKRCANVKGKRLES